MKRAWTPEDLATLAALTVEGVPVATIAARLGRGYGEVIRMRGVLKARGEIERLAPGGQREWTVADDSDLRELLWAGHDYDTIARRLGRSRNAIVIRCKRHLRLRLLRVPTLLTCREVATLLGLGCSKTVTRWIELGWLPGRKTRIGTRHVWRIHDLDLYDMLMNEQTWMAWAPERITDPDLRQWTAELRAGAPRWLTTGEVARRLGFVVGAVHRWIVEGRLPAVRYGNWYIRESDLVGFVAPIDAAFEQRHEQTRRAA